MTDCPTDCPTAAYHWKLSDELRAAMAEARRDADAARAEVLRLLADVARLQEEVERLHAEAASLRRPQEDRIFRLGDPRPVFQIPVTRGTT